MPVSLVVGGQYGSEGKGKVALCLARESRRRRTPTTVLRVGGSNSGHTGYDVDGRRWTLRQLPAAAIDRDVDVVFPDGAYIDPEILEQEIEALGFPRDRISISPRARIILREHADWEARSGLIGSIGSTGSGTGAAVLASVARASTSIDLPHRVAEDHAPLATDGFARMVRDPMPGLDHKLAHGERVIVEGSQGFGLSLAESGHWPQVTARTTTASGALAEAGLAPTHVDDIVLVLRSFPIRVAGASGPLARETTWDTVAQESGQDVDLREYTTVTKNLRRVGRFDAEVVLRAISYNAPTRIVLNHLDYVGPRREAAFLDDVEVGIGRKIDLLGRSPYSLDPRLGVDVGNSPLR